MTAQESFDNLTCYYCGEAATDTEHVIPRSVLEKLSDFPEQRAAMIKQRILLVKSCRECNLLLGPSVQETLIERKRYLKTRLKSRYKKLLKMPDWSEEELSEMGDRLRAHIEYSIHEKNAVLRRIAW